jgi:hypothetical protein
LTELSGTSNSNIQMPFQIGVSRRRRQFPNATVGQITPTNNTPTVSAYQYVHGIFDYNKTPLAPLGCAVQLLESNTQRGTWAEHSTDGWYIGTSMEHYRCHKIYVKKTKGERISDTVFFKHKYITQPTVTPVDTIVKALDDLTHALKGRRNVKGKAQIEALEKIDELLNNLLKQLEPERQQERQRKVTFDNGTAPPKESRVPTTRPTAPARNTSRPSIKKATIDKPIQPIASTPRVHEETKPVPTNTSPQKTLPAPRVMRKSRQIPPTIAQSKIREKIRDKTANRARLPH